MSVWTEERTDQLKRLWPQGFSAAAIATQLGAGLTRNAVLRKAVRLALPARRSGVRSTPAGSANCIAAPEEGTATILTVRRLDCRWPYGDPGDTGFSLCGRPSERGAFCGAHAAIAYRPVPQSIEGWMRLAGVVG